MHKMPTSKVSVGGRVVIPKEIREKLGIKSGDEVTISLEGRTIKIIPEGIKKPVEKLYGSVKVKPEESPKEVAREWVQKKTKDL